MTLKREDGRWNISINLTSLASIAVIVPIAWLCITRFVAVAETPEKQTLFENKVEAHFQKIEEHQIQADVRVDNIITGVNKLLQANGIAEWISTNQPIKTYVK